MLRRSVLWCVICWWFVVSWCWVGSGIGVGWSFYGCGVSCSPGCWGCWLRVLSGLVDYDLGCLGLYRFSLGVGAM